MVLQWLPVMVPLMRPPVLQLLGINCVLLLRNYNLITQSLALTNLLEKQRINPHYRSELAGILGILVMVQSLCTLDEIQEGAIEVALDNKSAAEQSAGDWLLCPRQRDYDMLLDIRSRLQALPIQVNF